MPSILPASVARLGRALGDLDAAALAAAAGVNLRLDDDGAAAEPLGDGARVIGGERDLAARHRHAVTRKNRLALILVNLHAALIL